MIGKPLRWSDLKYLAKFGEFWTTLVMASLTAFVLGLIAG
jgi:hypothetical protein